MRIRIEQFCNLSTNNAFQSWLYKYDGDLYQDLVNHLRASRGCAHNREKMVDLVGKIEARPGGRSAVMEFLRTSFPAMLEMDEGITPPEAPITTNDSDVPFVFNGVQLTFPRRIILQHANLGVLQENVRNFVTGKLRVEYVIIGNKAYIEYVPVSHARVLGQIPEKNWRVVEFKKNRGLI